MTEPACTPEVDAQAYQVLEVEFQDRADRGQEPVGRVLGVEAGLDGVPGHLDLRLAQRQRLARGHAQLPFHEVEAGDRLGDGMLDLQARVHLDEVPGRVGGELAALDQELDRAGALVGHRLGAGDGGSGDPGAQLRRHARRGGLLDHLLVAPLQRAVALEEMHDIAVGVAEHLHLDVARDGRSPSPAARGHRRRPPAPRARRSPARRPDRPRARPGACRARRRRPPP